MPLAFRGLVDGAGFGPATSGFKGPCPTYWATRQRMSRESCLSRTRHDVYRRVEMTLRTLRRRFSRLLCRPHWRLALTS